MRYFLIAFLFFLPIFCSNAQEVDSNSQQKSIPMGSVVTRSGTPVVTRSANVENMEQKKRSSTVIFPKKKKAPKRNTTEATPVSEEKEEANTIKAILKEDAKAYRKEAARLQADGDFESAVAYYKKAVQFDPLNVEAINDLGVAYESLGDTITAANMYKKALELNPSYPPAYTNLAFLYEEKGDIRNASYYWQKRYEMGRPGEYWTNVAKQHLMNLGTYPEVHKSMIDKEASLYAQEIATRRLGNVDDDMSDARSHYYMGERFYSKRQYPEALKEFESALALSPQDENLKLQIMDSYKKTEEAYNKEKILTETQDALNYIKEGNYYTAEEKLRGALSTVYQASQEK